MISKNQLRRVIEVANKQLKNPELTNFADRQKLVMVRESAYTAVKALQANDLVLAGKVLMDAGIQVAERSQKGYASTFNKQADILEYGKYASWHIRHLKSSLPLNSAGTRRASPIQTGVKDATVKAHAKTQSHEIAVAAVTFIAKGENMLRAAGNDDSRKAKAARTKAKKLIAIGQVASVAQASAAVRASEAHKGVLRYL